MGSELVARMIAQFPRISEDAQGLAVILADKAHDKDDQPCCWVGPTALTIALYGEDSTNNRRRFERRVVMLVEAGVISRVRKPHQRPGRRRCPRDGRKFHVEVFPAATEIIDAARRISGVSIADAERRISDDTNGEIVDAGRVLVDGNRRRGAREIVDAQRRALKELPIEQPVTSEPPSTRGRSSWRASGPRAADEPRCAQPGCGATEATHGRWMELLDADARHEYSAPDRKRAVS
jgi:hypothetical protein